jgi:hypothetical protein
MQSDSFMMITRGAKPAFWRGKPALGFLRPTYIIELTWVHDKKCL